jgi:uncharacterized repeat protein (TIGR01451 family)
MKKMARGFLVSVLAMCAASCGGGGSNGTGGTGTGGGSATPALSAKVSTQGNFSSGESNASYTITVSDTGSGATTGTVTVSDPPTGFAVTGISGNGWTCVLATVTCTRSDSLAGGSSFSPITVTGNVTSPNGTPVSIPITLSGGGTSSSVTVTPTPTITVAAPALSITKTHTGNFNQGQQGATYTVTVQNGASAGATNAKVTVTETVPSGESLVSMSGSGWTCPGSGGANTCDRSDTLPTRDSYPSITVTVNVAANAASPQVNQVSASGGGTTGSVSANDATTLNLLPTVLLSASSTNVLVGQPVTLTWSSSNATSCTASGGWSGSEGVSGSQTVTPTTAGSLTYTLSCTGAAGSANMSVIVTVTNPPPTVSLSSNANTVFVGQPITLMWSSTNATTCAATGAWTGTEQISGVQSITPASAGTLTYTLTCTGAGGTANASVSVVANTASLTLTNTFMPNSTTISTSEGAPYGDCDFWIQPAANCVNETNFGYGPTAVMRLYICLTGEVSSGDCSQEPPLTGPIPAQMLSDIDTRLAAYQGTGMRVMPRFIYNFGPIGPTAQDAPLSVILNNIDQLAPIVLKYKDIVFALEAGFIGTWGEWHDSTNGNDTAAAQAAVLNKEVSYFGGIFPILERYPGDLIQYVGNLTPPATIGLHDDYYASNSDDGGTWNTCVTTAGWCLDNYTPAQFQAFAAQVSTTTMFAGEFGALYAELQTCSALDSYSYTYHAQSISLNPYPATIGTELQDEGCALSFYNKVGTRIELQNATVIGNPTAGGQLYIGLTLANTGYGRVIRQRPATILLLSGSTVVAQFPLPLTTMDLTQLASSASPVPITFQTTLTLPSTFPSSGSISAVLLVPDPAPSLTSQPAYALPLNSVDSSNNPVFDPTTGYNAIGSFTLP